MCRDCYSVYNTMNPATLENPVEERPRARRPSKPKEKAKPKKAPVKKPTKTPKVKPKPTAWAKILDDSILA